jgi:hypothetical protein
MTIVGGRPPGSGQGIGAIPRGIEVLVRKAAVDAEFRAALLDERAAAAAQIGLTLEPAEASMLQGVPQAQLEAVIGRTRVPQEQRRAFLGNVAAAMLAALGVTTTGCGPEPPPAPAGIAPDVPPPTEGIRPDMPPPTGIAPDVPPPRGIRPDMPPEKPTERPEAPGNADPPPSKTVPEAPEPAIGTGIRPDLP